MSPPPVQNPTYPPERRSIKTGKARTGKWFFCDSENSLFSKTNFPCQIPGLLTLLYRTLRSWAAFYCEIVTRNGNCKVPASNNITLPLLPQTRQDLTLCPSPISLLLQFWSFSVPVIGVDWSLFTPPFVYPPHMSISGAALLYKATPRHSSSPIVASGASWRWRSRRNMKGKKDGSGLLLLHVDLKWLWEELWLQRISSTVSVVCRLRAEGWGFGGMSGLYWGTFIQEFCCWSKIYLSVHLQGKYGNTP